MQSNSNNFIKPSLTVRKLLPENKESPIQFIETELIDKKLFYRRNHFPYPALTSSNFWLPVNGLVKTPKIFSFNEIMSLPSKTLMVTLECAGNKRSFFEPRVFGEQFEKGAINKGIWKGVSLKNIIELTGIKDGVKEILVESYDFGKQPNLDKIYSFSRSLPLDKALHPDTIMAYEYNNQPIPFTHGYPFRLIVPQWYAMASVKWVKSINVIDYEFKGPFQAVDYVYYPYKDSDEGAIPVSEMNVNSTIQKPLDMEILDPGRHLIKGIAWTGKGIITKVEVSVDKGETWEDAILNKQSQDSYGWLSWTYEWFARQKGEYTIMSRATDSYHRTQPEIPFWNRKGYGYHGCEKVKVRVE